MANTEVGTAVIKLSFDGKDVSAELTSLSNQIEKKGKTSGTNWANAWTTAAGSLISKGVSKITSFISDNFSYASKRLDTLNKFPIALKNLGINADDASKAINDLSEYTLGLPTTLNDAAEKVQLFTASTGDVHKSVKIFEALNDAVVSGAQSTEVQTTAIYQWSQALARGSFDVEREYMAMVDANAAAVNQVAQNLLGTEANFNTLWDALKEGKVTVDDVIDAMINLDENGTGALQSWHDNARDSAAGIDVAMTRLQTNMGKALVAIIEDTIGWEGLYTAINKIGDGIYETGKMIGGFLKNIWPLVENVFNFLLGNKWLVGFILSVIAVVKLFNAVTAASIVVAVVALIADLVLLVTHLDEVGQWFQNTFGWVGDFVGGVAQNIRDFFDGVFKWIGDNLGWMGDIFGKIFGSVWKVVSSVLGAIGSLFKTVFTVAGAVVKVFFSVFSVIFNVVFNVAKTVLTAIGTVAGIVFNAIGTALGVLGNIFRTIFTAVGTVVSTVFNVISTVVAGVFDWIRGALDNMRNSFTTVFNAIWGTVSSVFERVKAFMNSVFEGIRNGIRGVGDFFRGVFTSISDKVNNVVKGIKDAFSGAWEAVKNGATGAWNTITGIFGRVADFFGNIFSDAWSRVKAVFSTGGQIFAGITQGIANVFRSMVNNIIGGINSVVAVPFNAINGILDGIRNVEIVGLHPFSWVGSILVPQIPYLAQGGVVDSQTLAMIGEQGKEAVIPLEDNQDNWAGLLASAIEEEMSPRSEDQRPITVYINNHINNKMDAEDIGRIMMQSIRRAA